MYAYSSQKSSGSISENIKNWHALHSNVPSDESWKKEAIVKHKKRLCEAFYFNRIRPIMEEAKQSF